MNSQMINRVFLSLLFIFGMLTQRGNVWAQDSVEESDVKKGGHSITVNFIDSTTKKKVKGVECLVVDAKNQIHTKYISKGKSKGNYFINVPKGRVDIKYCIPGYFPNYKVDVQAESFDCDKRVKVDKDKEITIELLPCSGFVGHIRGVKTGTEIGGSAMAYLNGQDDDPMFHGSMRIITFAKGRFFIPFPKINEPGNDLYNPALPLEVKIQFEWVGNLDLDDNSLEFEFVLPKKFKGIKDIGTKILVIGKKK